MSDASFASLSSGSSVAMNDPINAPPPPLASQQALAMPGVVEEAGRPMMLVPAPGGTAQSSGTSTMSVRPNVSSNPSVPPVMTAPVEQPVAMETSFPSVPMNSPSDSQFSLLNQQMSPETRIVSSATVQTRSMGREFIPASISSQSFESTSVSPGEIRLTRGQQNVLQRFSILERLVAEGLVTRSEREQRRMENVGAILPYSHGAPAATLEREVPSGDAISARLSSLKRSLELRVITPRQHSIERGMILDALLPNDPRSRATPAPPPQDVIAAAGMIGQLERLRYEGVISDSEFDQERAAIDGYLTMGEIPTVGGQSVTTPSTKTGEAKTAKSMQAALGLHLASYRSQQAAESGWRTISGKYASQLGDLNSTIRRVNLGAGKGTFYRLLAGPLADRGQANTICQQLKRSNQYCDPLSLGG